MIREFIPEVDWDRLASMHVAGRTGAECQSRWLNCQDPLINQGPWTSAEDKSLLHIVQNMGMGNWFGIAVSLGTNRTPFQCLARYQRSLNPSMLNSEWTEEEDAQLFSAVALYGESDWQSVASVLERRTGTQCSDRYLNSLDPSLKWGGWTKEEDARLEAAINKHGCCWSKVTQDVPPRTDCQCRKRWKVLFPEHVPLLQKARKVQKSLLPSNFVDRKSERPALTLNDFLPSDTLGSPSNGGALGLPLKRSRKSSNVPKNKRSKRQAKKAPIPPEEVEHVVCSDRSDSEDLNNITLASFVCNKSKKGRFK